MIKIQKEDFNLEEEIQKIKALYSTVGAITSFVGYVRDTIIIIRLNQLI